MFAKTMNFFASIMEGPLFLCGETQEQMIHNHWIKLQINSPVQWLGLPNVLPIPYPA